MENFRQHIRYLIFLVVVATSTTPLLAQDVTNILPLSKNLKSNSIYFSQDFISGIVKDSLNTNRFSSSIMFRNKQGSDTVFSPFPSWNSQNSISGHLGIMCRYEDYFEEKTKIPLRMRLGSLDYTERMEGYR